MFVMTVVSILLCCLLPISANGLNLLSYESTSTANTSMRDELNMSSADACTKNSCQSNRVCVNDKKFVKRYRCCKTKKCSKGEGLFCKDPGEIDNATRLPSVRSRNFDVNERVFIRCIESFTWGRDGEYIITCMETGKWSKGIPVCTSLYHVNHVNEPVLATSPNVITEPDSAPPSQTVVIAIGVSSVCLLMLFIVAWFVWRRYKRVWSNDYRLAGRQESVCYSPTLPQPTDFNEGAITAEEFMQYVAVRHRNNDQQFLEEFEEVQNRSAPRITWETSSMSENREKNRYTNIVAYDHSRVHLHARRGRQAPHLHRDSDYINANYVSSYFKPKAYIACQGPLPSTFNDFWKMVWENNTCTIVMITNLVEKGRRKCDQYWPQEGKEQYKHISVTLKRTEAFANYTIRTFAVKNTRLSRRNARGGERRILQFHFTQWPDHGTPEYLLPVLTFIRRSFAANPSHAGPIVIHCSAGVGRTGTYIVIHSMMQMLQATGTINIKEFLRLIRLQRNHLVQTEDQYVFVHDALLEYIMSGSTECSPLQVEQYHRKLTAPIPGMGSCVIVNEEAGGDGDIGSAGLRTGLQKQFLKVSYSRGDVLDSEFAMRPFNERKNRPGSVLPVFRSRVLLCNRTSAEGSDYINASFVQGYRSSHEFIITQLPLPNTRNDFWQLIWDHNCPTIVTIMDDEWNPETDPYWPSADKPLHCNSFNVSFGSENVISAMGNNCGVLTRDFILEATKDDYVLEVKQYQLSNWDKETPSIAQLKAVSDIVKYTLSKDGSTVIQDRLGSTAATQLACWHSMQCQLDNENVVDVYQTAVVACQMRPRVFTSLSHLGFLYQAAILEANVRSPERASGDDKGVSPKMESPNGVVYSNNASGSNSTCTTDSRSETTETDKLVV